MKPDLHAQWACIIISQVWASSEHVDRLFLAVAWVGAAIVIFSINCMLSSRENK